MNYKSMTLDASWVLSPSKQIASALGSKITPPSTSSQQILSKSIDHITAETPNGTRKSGGLSKAMVLARRALRNGLCQRGHLLARFLLPLAIVFLTVMFFWRLDRSAAGMASRLGLFHQLMGTTLAGLIVHIALFPREVRAVNVHLACFYCAYSSITESDFLSLLCQEQREIAFREISDGAYDASSFLLSYMVVELPLSFLSALASTVVVFAVTGLQTDSGDSIDGGAIAPGARNVLSMILVLFAYITTGESLGIAYSAWLGDHGGLGVALMNSTVSKVCLFEHSKKRKVCPELCRILNSVLIPLLCYNGPLSSP